MTAAARSVLVVGGGPAGLAAGTALRQRGMDAEIVEIDPELRPLGNGLTMMGPTLRALRELDVEGLEACLEQGAGHPAISFGNAQGDIMESLELPRAAGAEYPGGFGITRPVFWRILSHMAQQAGAHISLGTTLTEIDQTDDAATVTFSDGSRKSYDLVVGADGLHSRVRELIFPDTPEPSFNGQRVWRAMVPRPSQVSDDMAMYYGALNKAGCNPVSATEMYIFLVENNPDPERPPREDLPRLMREQLAEYDGVIGWARERMTDPRKVDCRPQRILLVPPPWHRGRVLLIGDAAHSTTPHLAMGAGIAIEDGIVLADELASHDALQTALEAFTARRYDRCRMVVENSAQLGAWEQDPAVPASEHARLSNESWGALAAPI